MYDTPALQLDCWMTLALAAVRTERITLGPGVLIPSLRHPMATAAAIACCEATEVAFRPNGDIPRELRAFAKAADLS